MGHTSTGDCPLIDSAVTVGDPSTMGRRSKWEVVVVLNTFKGAMGLTRAKQLNTATDSISDTLWRHKVYEEYRSSMFFHQRETWHSRRVFAHCKSPSNFFAATATKNQRFSVYTVT